MILDRLLRAWLAEHAGVQLRGGRDEREYAMWLLIAQQLAKALKITAEELELAIFTAALPADSPWRAAPRVKAPRRPKALERSSTSNMHTSRVVLLGCVKLKLEHRAPAKDLYASPLWNGRRAYAEAAGCPWLILSAKHGLLDPGEVIAPYDLALADLPAIARRAWGERVVGALEQQFGSISGMTFEVHGGEAHRAAIAQGILERGATIEQPLLGLTMGRQLSWYSGRSPRSERDVPLLLVGRQRRREVTLCGPRADDDHRTRLCRPDWRDQVAIGQAGAMTLTKRIGGNHLNGQIRGSTFRLTLASILIGPERLTSVACGQLDRDSEQRLSQWMRSHLHVAVHPFGDRDALADLERRVLAELDPPLSLDGRHPTVVRVRLSELRRRLAAA